eukprot:scaffold4952_cov76-Isochrysis_galbana.AAC.1
MSMVDRLDSGCSLRYPRSQGASPAWVHSSNTALPKPMARSTPCSSSDASSDSPRDQAPADKQRVWPERPDADAIDHHAHCQAIKGADGGIGEADQPRAVCQPHDALLGHDEEVVLAHVGRTARDNRRGHSQPAALLEVVCQSEDSPRLSIQPRLLCPRRWLPGHHAGHQLLGARLDRRPIPSVRKAAQRPVRRVSTVGLRCRRAERGRRLDQAEQLRPPRARVADGAVCVVQADVLVERVQRLQRHGVEEAGHRLAAHLRVARDPRD